MALTAPRNTAERAGLVIPLPVAAATKIFQGGLGAVDSAGRAVPAADTAGLRVIGRAESDADNTTGAAGDISVNLKRGTYLFANSATAAVDADDVGKICFVEDDETVAETSTHKVKAGRVVEVSSEGVWVDTTEAHHVPAADTITGAADLAALKVVLLALLQGAGIVK
jgi:hypothetical protein